MNRIFTRISMAALVGVATFGLSTDAAAQTTFEACRVPNVGAIYMINVAGAPSACLDPSHVMFSWTEGSGSVGPGSIGTAELADDAVTSAKIADGGVAGVDIAAGAIGSGQLATDAVDANAIAMGAVGSAEIADGSVGAADLENAAIITGTQLNSNIVASNHIVDGSVGTADLAPGSAVFFTQADYGLSSFNASSSTVTNLASITIDAPRQGIVLVMGTGYCNKTQGVSAYQIFLGWETSPSTTPGVIPSAFISSRPGEPAGSVQYPYATSELFSVSAGTNTFYLNGYNSNGGAHSCAGSNTIIFAPAVIS